MSNALYDNARELALTTGLNWTTATIKAQLIDTANYTFSLTHNFLSEVSVNSRIGSPVTLTGKSGTGGAANADNITFTGVPIGNILEAIIIYADTGNDTTSYLIAYIDTVPGLPVTPNGNNIVLTIGDDENKLFRV